MNYIKKWLGIDLLQTNIQSLNKIAQHQEAEIDELKEKVKELELLIKEHETAIGHLQDIEDYEFELAVNSLWNS